MADSELGELRRPPRPVEHRIERIARWRAQGLAGGASDSPFPVDFVDGSAVPGATEDGAGGGVIPDWYFETFSVTSGSASTVTLTYVPTEYSEVVRLNGVTLARTVDYTISESTLTFADLTGLRLGIGSNTWTLDVSYAYTDTAEVPFEARDFLLWTLDDSATIVGSDVRLNPATSGTRGGMTCPDVIPSGWSIIDITITLNQASGDGWYCILSDAAQNLVTSSLTSYYTFSFADTNPGGDRTRFISNDGTTTIDYVNGGSGFLTGTHEYRTVFTKTGANTGSVTRYVDGGLITSTTTDLWVPSTVYVSIAGFAGGLYSNSHTVSAVTVDVS